MNTGGWILVCAGVAVAAAAFVVAVAWTAIASFFVRLFARDDD